MIEWRCMGMVIIADVVLYCPHGQCPPAQLSISKNRLCSYGRDSQAHQLKQHLRVCYWPIAGVQMQHEGYFKQNFPHAGTKKDPTDGASEGPSPATAATGQREPLLIMESLLREYLTSPLRTN